MSEHILADKKIILDANKIDIENAKSKKLSASFIDRLELNEERISSISDALKEIDSLNRIFEIKDFSTRTEELTIGLVIHK